MPCCLSVLVTNNSLVIVLALEVAQKTKFIFLETGLGAVIGDYDYLIQLWPQSTSPLVP